MAKKQKNNAPYFEVEELVCHILELDYDLVYTDERMIEEKLIEKFGLNLDEFEQLITVLLPLINIEESPLTGIKYTGFSDKKAGMWLLKIKSEI